MHDNKCLLLMNVALSKFTRVRVHSVSIQGTKINQMFVISSMAWAKWSFFQNRSIPALPSCLQSKSVFTCPVASPEKQQNICLYPFDSCVARSGAPKYVSNTLSLLFCWLLCHSARVLKVFQEGFVKKAQSGPLVAPPHTTSKDVLTQSQTKTS
jgi:hypothetical protein